MIRLLLKHFVIGGLILSCISWISSSAAEDLYSVINTSDIQDSWKQNRSQQSNIHINLQSSDNVVATERFNIQLPEGGSEIGVVTKTKLKGPSIAFLDSKESSAPIIISLENNRGSLEVTSIKGKVSGLLLYDNQEKSYFKANIDNNGFGRFVKQEKGLYQCPELPLDTNTVVAMPADIASIPDLDALQNLESKPGATNTIYLNYWGGTLTGTSWNTNFNSNNPINYTPYDHYSDDNPSEFTEYERYLMWLAWREMAEDYSSFDVNITTSQSVYDTADSTNRSQIIATTTDFFYPGAGGVAYLNSFGSDYYGTGFTWNSGPGSMGTTHSHEAGHQMGLSHHGTSTSSYYSGHGNWGAIMGAPFYQRYVQWSKGEYFDANNTTQDDLQIITEVLSVDVDDAGNSTETATALTIPVRNFEGHIKPDGIADDTDVYSFQLTSSGDVSIKVVPLLGDEEEYYGSNLAMNASLKSSSGDTIVEMTSSDNEPLEPLTNKLAFEGTLEADTYYLVISGASPDTSWETGFGEFGNEGFYRISIDAEVESKPSITFPVQSDVLPNSVTTFKWNSNGVAPSYYRLKVGTTGAGSKDLFNKRLSGITTERKVTGLPTDGRTIYVRLSWKVDGKWSEADYTYTTTTAPYIVAPVEGTVLSDSTQVFQWDTGTMDIQYFRLKVGTTGVGGKDLFNKRVSANTTEHEVAGLPTDGQTLYVRLSWKVEGKWSEADYTYTAPTIQTPEIINPTEEGETLSGNTQLFQWNTGAMDVQYFRLKIGTTGIGSKDVFNKKLLGDVTEKEVTILPTDGSTLYVRLQWRSNGAWFSKDYTYVASD